MSDCTHDCSSCSASCGERTASPEDFLEKLHAGSSVKKVIGIVSGKGGVGKSMVTSLLAVGMNRAGYKTAILDADITGPSVPKAFGLDESLLGTPEGLIVPAMTNTGIDVVSVNLLLENQTDPVLWRGPILGGIIKQFWGETVWKNIDYMFIDMPPGTGDVPLTVFQSLPLDGIIVVTSPQELVSMIVGKAINMAKMMNVPIIGLVENMSYFVCPDCGRKLKIFGESGLEKVAKECDIPILGRLPIDPELAKLCDEGRMEESGEYLSEALRVLEKL